MLAAFRHLEQIDASFDATELGGNQVIRDSAVSQIYRLLEVYGVLPGEYNATHLGEHQVLAGDASQIQPPAPETVQPTDAQEAGVPAGGDTSGRLHCPYGDCKTTFGRSQERGRHFIDVHVRRRQCPFPSCNYEWSRPGKIKTHLMVNHQDNLPPEVLNGICAKRGRHLVTFLNSTL